MCICVSVALLLPESCHGLLRSPGSESGDDWLMVSVSRGLSGPLHATPPASVTWADWAMTTAAFPGPENHTKPKYSHWNLLRNLWRSSQIWIKYWHHPHEVVFLLLQRCQQFYTLAMHEDSLLQGQMWQYWYVGIYYKYSEREKRTALLRANNINMQIHHKMFRTTFHNSFHNSKLQIVTLLCQKCHFYSV